MNLVSIFRKALNVLPAPDRHRFWFLALSQALLGMLDLAGVAMLGAVGALSVRTIQSQTPGFLVTTFLKFLHMEESSLQVQVSVLSGLAVLLLVIRTIVTYVVARKTLVFLSNRGSVLSGKLAHKILGLTLDKVNEFSAIELQYALGPGMTAITLGVIGSGSTIIADLSLLLILGIGVTLVNPLIAFCSLLLFSVTGYVLYLNLHHRAHKIGEEISEYSILLNSKIQQSIESYRDLYVRNFRQKQASQMTVLKEKSSALFAEQTLLPYLSKYVIEIALVLGALSIASLQFLTQDISRAVTGLFLFIAAGSRIAPALLRLQQSAISIQSNSGIAIPTIELISGLEQAVPVSPATNKFDFIHKGFNGSILAENICFRYKPNSHLVLENVSFQIEPGKVVAFVGTSGAGKSTLVDLLLGLLAPESGHVEISELAPGEVVERWPGAISYVPQDVVLFDGSIQDNISFFASAEELNEKALTHALRSAQLEEFIQSLPEGLETHLGARGIKISGGQKQRIGIARALYTNPKLLIMDEATSALDGLTEAEISKAIQRLRGSVTVVLIAHRLSTAQKADLVIYLEEGSIKASGNFNEVRLQVKKFDEQARSMGL